MDSQIDFVDSQTLTPKPDVTPGRILVSSKNLNWQGIHIEKGENEGFTPDDVTVTQHYFAMNTGPALEWEWKDGNQFKTHRYETGDLWINPAGVPFSHRIDGHNQFVLLTLDPEKLAALLPDGLKHQSFQRRHQSKDKHLQMLIQALLIEAEMCGPNGTLYVESLATALATHYANHYLSEPSVELQRFHALSERQRFSPVLDYIEAHLTEDISLSELSLQAGLSKFHFSRLFKQALGLTPHKYLIKRRIEQATQQLKKGQPINQVAHQFGFSDQSHFTRMFKQVQGCTPRQYLKRLL
ncbi:MAG: AraC family transcriptional regulator [Cyanobacteria bacterium P01_D01_bin.156]